ncbi:MAG TPA: BON domain-containing protein [Vicinamibacterales bacterium]
MLQKFAALVGAAALTVACAQTDAGITMNVKSKMAADDTVKAYQLDVDTSNGVVSLSGDVDSPLAKERAIQIARNTDGVRDVVDNITVTESAPTGGLFDRDDVDGGESLGDKARQEGREAVEATERAARRGETVVADAAITTAVKAKFLADTTVSGLKINVDTSDGIVTLTGNVGSRAEADRAVMMARNTEGVSRVVNNLRVGTN